MERRRSGRLVELARVALDDLAAPGCGGAAGAGRPPLRPDAFEAA